MVEQQSLSGLQACIHDAAPSSVPTSAQLTLRVKRVGRPNAPGDDYALRLADDTAEMRASLSADVLDAFPAAILVGSSLTLRNVSVLVLSLWSSVLIINRDCLVEVRPPGRAADDRVPLGPLGGFRTSNELLGIPPPEESPGGALTDFVCDTAQLEEPLGRGALEPKDNSTARGLEGVDERASRLRQSLPPPTTPPPLWQPPAKRPRAVDVVPPPPLAVNAIECAACGAGSSTCAQNPQMVVPSDVAGTVDDLVFDDDF